MIIAKRWKILQIFSILLLIRFSYAQTGTEFWFVVPEVISSSDATNRGRTALEGLHGDRPGVIRLSSLNQPTTVTISRPANPSFKPRIINLGAFETRTDTIQDIDDAENWPPNTVLNKGIFIKATAPITAYYEEASNNNPEIFPLKGNNALGRLFYIPSQNEFRNQRGSAAFDIVAIEDNTTVKITLANRVRGAHVSVTTPAYQKGDVITVVLHRGQTFSCRAVVGTGVASLANKLTGTKIESDKPIAVVYTDDSIITGTSGWDLVGDQLVPVSVVGTEYIAVTGRENYGKEVIYVTSTQPDTRIYVNGSSTPVAVLAQAGSTFSIKMNVNDVATYVRADKPVYAVHLSGISTPTSTGGEQGDAVLPPINCTGTNSQRFVRTTGLTFSIMLLTKNGNQDGFRLIVPRSTVFHTFMDTLDILSASSFREVPGTNGEWVAARFDFPTGDTRIPHGSNRASQIINTKGLFHMGMLNNVGASATYGYFSDYSPINLPENLLAVEGEPVILAPTTSNSYAGELFKWFHNGNLIDSVSRSIVVSDSGIYKLEYNAPGCPILEDSVKIRFVKRPTFELWNGKRDTTVCQNTSLAVTVQIPPDDTLKANTHYAYEWFDLQTNQRISQNQTLMLQNRSSGTFRYRIKVTDFSTSAQAFRNDTITVTVRPAPQAGLGLQDTICFYNLPYTFRANPADSLNIYAYRWNHSFTDTFSYFTTYQQNTSIITVPLEIKNVITGCKTDTFARLWVELNTGFIPQFDLGERVQFVEKSSAPFLLRTTSFPTNIGFPPRYEWRWLENSNFFISTHQNPFTNPLAINVDTTLRTVMTYTLTAISGSSSVIGPNLTNVKPFCQTIDTVSIVIYQAPRVKLPADTTFCNGSIDTLIISNLDTTNLPSVRYLWSTGDTVSQIRYVPTANKTDTVVLTVIDTFLGRTFSVSDTMFIRSVSPPVFFLNDTLLERSRVPFVLNARHVSHSSATAYRWNSDSLRNRDTLMMDIDVPSYSVYTVWVVATDYSTSARCSSSDTIRVEIFERPRLPWDTIIGVCEGGFPVVLRGRDRSHSTSIQYYWDNYRGVDSLVIYHPDTVELLLRDTAFSVPIESKTRFYVSELPFYKVSLMDTIVERSSLVKLQVDSVDLFHRVMWRRIGDTTYWGHCFAMEINTDYPKYTQLQYEVLSINTNLNASCAFRDTVKILIYEKPIVFLGNDTVVCKDTSPLLLTNKRSELPQNSNLRYVWQDSIISSTYTFYPNKSQFIVLTSIDSLIPGERAQSRDTIRIEVKTLPIVYLGGDTLIWRDLEPILIRNYFYQPDVTYEWNHGAGGYQTSISRNFLQDTVLKLILKATDNWKCVSSDTLNLYILYRPLINLPFRDTVVCSDNFPFFISSIALQDSQNLYYQWLKDQKPIGNRASLVVDDTGKYEIVVSDNRYSPPRFYKDSLVIKGRSSPRPTIFSSRQEQVIKGICENETDILSVYPAFRQYRWNTGDTTPTLRISAQVNTYAVTVTDEYSCKGVDSIDVQAIYPLPKLNFPHFVEPLCENGFYEISINQPNITTVQWSDGISGMKRTFEENGQYITVLTDTNGCQGIDTIEIWYKCLNEINLPDAFTPNGDGINDVFEPLGKNILRYEMTIYNRWGEVMFYTNKSEGWNGKWAGSPVSSGTYFYKIFYEIQYGKERKVGNKEGAVIVLDTN
ncbi:MAG: gliding motility-associated C-terminal domain-containing protein [Cytophagales bacterium]|nr:gliding motility-associated C-terminal domain-containing protein [Cytophagales bacterium]MDW8383141.1 gliding motility-associated C-terminal domain-containing protein [Flammeovirgaceae bacterium]